MRLTFLLDMAKPKPSRSDAKQLLVPECSVSGPLALVLHVSRVVGVAPLRFRRSGGAWRVKMSMAACIYTFLIATTINLGALICLLLDNSTRNLSPIRRFTRLWDFLLVVAIASVVAYGAPRRLKETISCLARIGKINASTLKKPSRKTVLSATFIICFIILVVLFTLDYKIFVSGSAFKYSITTPTYFYFTYFYAYLMLVLFETQYVLIAFEVANAFQELGNLFEDTSRLINVYYASHDDVIASMPLKVVPTKSVNQIVDSMAQIKSTPVFSVTPTLESVSETIRRLALMYAEVCSVVRQLDSCHGLVVVMLLLSFLLHLVVSVYNFIMSSTCL
ncbi:unnamed protein product [Chilo suppressalis]|uniref:Gustatory receptor n=1 Tax=Chilo suppressalis TaxID=168631 RepID=A0ABN8B9E7_CHISP|nr:unnamed protein product [Chilo suppressalis]